jgi:hypothetical protein
VELKDMTPRGQRLYNRCLQLGYKDIRPQPHAEMLNFAANHFAHIFAGRQTQDKAVELVPRGCFKTSACTIAGTIDCLAENPNLRFLWCTHTHDYTKQILGEVKWHYERNADLRAEVGDVKAGSPKWAEEAITLSTRTRNTKEPSIDTCGLDNPKVGGHYDCIIVDDIHTRENITPRMLRKAWHFIVDLRPVLEPGGLLFVIGTRWHMSDIYANIYKQNEDLKKRGQENQMWDILRRGCFDGPGGVYFPTRLTKAFLEEQRLALDDKTFAAQYLNQAISEDAQLFPPSLLKPFEGEFHAPEDAAPYIELVTTA